MHVFTALSCSHTRFVGLGLCLTTLLLAGCSNDSPTTPPVLQGTGFAYVSNKFSNNVSAYRIDANTGALTAVAGSPFAAGTSPNRISLVGF